MVHRVTGLDVGLLIEVRSVRFGKEAAHVVDAIHTGSPVTSSSSPQAMVDFYVNGGRATQPGCLRVPDRLFEDFYDFEHFGELKNWYKSRWRFFHTRYWPQPSVSSPPLRTEPMGSLDYEAMIPNDLHKEHGNIS